MLKTFYVDNFKTHINTTYNLHPVNLLIGMNNSGKTNLCQALRLIGLTSVLPLSDAARTAAAEEWTLANFYLAKSTIDFRVEAELSWEGEICGFSYELSVNFLDTVAARQTGRRLGVERETLKVSTPSFAKILIQNHQGNVQILRETEISSQDKGYLSTEAPTDTTMLSRLFDFRDNPRANLFRKYLGSWIYYDLDSQQLRKPKAKLLEQVLNPDGSNLASVLFNLKNGNERIYRKLIEVTRNSIEPRLELLSFFSPAENQVFMFGEDRTGNRFGPWSMSNGTLRFMALAYVFLSQHTHLEIGGPRLILVEEPETGLYAGHLKDLFSLVDPKGNNGQFVFTSHSPYFIDLFDGLLEGVTVAKRGEKSSQLLSPDPRKLRKRLETMPLGEMHFREMLV